jgi:hypothetical protein
MQINRLTHLIFPPAAPESSGVSIQPDATKSETGQASAVASADSVPVRKSAAVETSATPADAISSSRVTLTQYGGNKALNSSVYTRDGVLMGRASATADQTPAEQFVASAVDILRNFDATKMVQVGGSVADSPDHMQALSASRFGNLRQVVAKLNVFA